MKKRRTLIASHGTLASGLAKALSIIVGPQSDLEVMDCYLDADFNLDEAILEMFQHIDFEHEELYVFTDLFGGSVNNGFVKQLGSYRFHLVSNSSLGLLMDYFLTPADLYDVETRVKDDAFCAVYCNEALRCSEQTEEDF